MNATNLLTFLGTVLVAAIPGFFAYRASSRQAREARRTAVATAASAATIERQKIDLEQQRQHDATLRETRENYERILRSLRGEIDRQQTQIDRLQAQVAREQALSDTLRARVAALEQQQRP